MEPADALESRLSPVDTTSGTAGEVGLPSIWPAGLGIVGPVGVGAGSGSGPLAGGVASTAANTLDFPPPLLRTDFGDAVTGVLAGLFKAPARFFVNRPLIPPADEGVDVLRTETLAILLGSMSRYAFILSSADPCRNEE